jgi:hypothetical protein
MLHIFTGYYFIYVMREIARKYKGSSWLLGVGGIVNVHLKFKFI